MSCFYPDPVKRDIGEETRDTLQAQIDLAPEQYRVTKEYRQKYADMDMESAKDYLLGHDDQQGLLSLMEEELIPASMRQEQAAREADIATVERLGPRATAAFKASDPQQAQLIDALTRAVMANIGTGMSAGDARNVRQGVRGAQAARGLGYSPRDALAEAVMMDRETESRRNSRLSNAMQWAQTRAGMTVDPFLAALGRPSTTGAQAMSGFNSGTQAGAQAGSQFDPFNAYANDVYGSNANQQFAANTAKSNWYQYLGKEGIELGKSLMGGLIGCWVAREVFGQDNPKWLVFRAWLFEDAPVWFRDLYLENGERFANWLKGHGWLKGVIRVWMDAIVRRKLSRGDAEVLAHGLYWESRGDAEARRGNNPQMAQISADGKDGYAV